MAKKLKKVTHPAATYVGPQETVMVDGQEELQQEIHFDHPSVGTCGVLIRRTTGLGTVKVVAFSLPDRLRWNCSACRADDVQTYDPGDMLEAMWYEFQNPRAE